MVTPLSPCDLNEFDVETCFSFWPGCVHVGERQGAERCQSVLCSGFQPGISNWAELGVGKLVAFEKSGFALLI